MRGHPKTVGCPMTPEDSVLFDGYVRDLLRLDPSLNLTSREFERVKRRFLGKLRQPTRSKKLRSFIEA